MMMKKMLATMTAAALGLAMVAATPASANLLTDPGFEAGPLVDDGNGVGKWNPFAGGGATSQTSADMPRSGAESLKLTIDNTPNTFAGAFQDVGGLSAGQLVTWEGWTKDSGQDAGGAEIRIEWLDAGNGEVSRTGNLVPTLTPGVYTAWSLTEAVPAGAVTARVVYAIQSFGAGPNQLHYVDDTSVTVVPEPASLALLGLGALAMIRRK